MYRFLHQSDKEAIIEIAVQEMCSVFLASKITLSTNIFVSICNAAGDPSFSK